MATNPKNTGRKTTSRRGKEDFIRYYRPTHEDTLLNYLLQVLKDKSRTTVKSLLAHKQVAINNRPVTKFDMPVHPTDEVSINFDRAFQYFKHPLLSIVYEDDDLIIVDKQPGLLSIAPDFVKDRSVFKILVDYTKKRDLRNRIFIVHRLDREASGLMVFARNPRTQTRLQQEWEKGIIERKYQAVVEGQLDQPSGEITSYFSDPAQRKGGKEAAAEVSVIRFQEKQVKGRYTLVELDARQGKHLAVREQLHKSGHPIAGDRKFAAATNPGKRLMLHASKIAFKHPVSRQPLVFESPLPPKFKLIME